MKLFNIKQQRDPKNKMFALVADVELSHSLIMRNCKNAGLLPGDPGFDPQDAIRVPKGARAWYTCLETEKGNFHQISYKDFNTGKMFFTEISDAALV